MTISDSAREYKNKFTGELGVIKQAFRTHDRIIMYGVRLDNYQNLSSRKGLFWFREVSLSFINSENSETIESEEIPMFENYTVAKIQFLDGVPVYSHALYDPNVHEGDIVVVKTRNHGFALAKVLEINTDPEAKKEVTGGRQVICKVDFSAYNARQEALHRANELKRSMDAMLAETQAMAIYEMFAEKNPSLKAMLNEFKSLQSEIKGVPYGEEAHEAV